MPLETALKEAVETGIEGKKTVTTVVFFVKQAAGIFRFKALFLSFDGFLDFLFFLY
jgi:hypothetical protein